VWRFDFEGPSSSEWKVGFNGKPFFVATDKSHTYAQPIVAAPVFANHTSGGRIVLFGTGRLIDATDSDNTSSQTFYGAWDPTKEGASSAQTESPFATVAFDRDVLQEQIIHTDAVLNVGGTGSYYKVDSTPVNWEKQLGWFADLPFAGQRVIYPSAVLGKDYVLFSTMVPATKAETCRSNSGTGYNYILAAQDGTQATEPIFDTDGNGVVDEKDLVVGGYGTGSDGRDAIVSDPDHPLIGGDSSGGKGQICDTSSECKNIELPCLTNCTSPVITDRIWQRILTPPKP
jgi:type IV pilus assembly protein PilY1